MDLNLHLIVSPNCAYDLQFLKRWETGLTHLVSDQTMSPMDAFMRALAGSSLKAAETAEALVTAGCEVVVKTHTLAGSVPEMLVAIGPAGLAPLPLPLDRASQGAVAVRSSQHLRMCGASAYIVVCRLPTRAENRQDSDLPTCVAAAIKGQGGFVKCVEPETGEIHELPSSHHEHWLECLFDHVYD